jgi:hypothetical protein
MAPKDDDQASERESRVEELMKSDRRERPLARRQPDERPPKDQPSR